MGNYLRLWFGNDGDGSGKLFAHVEADGFSGKGAAHFTVNELEEFAAALQVFPIPPEDSRRSIAGGFRRIDDPNKLEQEHLGISVYLANPQSGYVGVQVRIETEAHRHSRPEAKKKLVAEILATYEPLSRFSRDLLSVLHGSLAEAVLKGERIS
jgi:hypothetical protein